VLASITPLGERARNSRWWATVVFYVLGSVAGGAALGALLGFAGQPLAGTSPELRLGALAVLLAAGLAYDLRLGGLRLPTVHRQVRQIWLDRYRGWVYGIGFGFQLGLGVVTIVSTAAVYATFAACFLGGSWAWGAVVGGAFGAVRAATIFLASRVRSPRELDELSSRLGRWEPRSRYATEAVAAALLALLLAAML
jgi:hypothetical protein